MSVIEMARLCSIHPDIQPFEFVLQEGLYTIGRSDKCDIVIKQIGQKNISRLHAEIECNGLSYILRDARSRNGTFVNDRKINEPYLLQDEDKIGLGTPEALLCFLDPDPTDVVASRLRYDARIMKFLLDGSPLDLTLKEFQILHYLYEHIGAVCKRQDCFEAVWKRGYTPELLPDAETLDRFVSNIRQKIREVDAEADLIKTHRGQGYQLVLKSIS